MALVLATDIQDTDEDGNVRTIAKRGDKLPASLKDNEEEYILEGILAEEHLVRPREDAVFLDNTSDTLTRMEYERVQQALSKKDLDNAEQAAKDAEAAASISKPSRAVNDTVTTRASMPVNDPDPKRAAASKLQPEQKKAMADAAKEEEK